MAAAPSRARARDLASTRWGVLSLLVASSFINYIDRGNLSIAAPLLSVELSITPVRLGLLLSAFFWTYSIFQMVSGWLIDRYNMYFIYGLGFCLWSAATAFTGLATSFWMLFALRLILGVGESVAYPAYSKIICAGFPEHRRGLANSLVDIGTKCGPALGMLIGGLVIARYGWRTLFLVLGGGAFLWLIPWGMFTPRDGHFTQADAAGGPTILEIARQRSAWGTFLGLFCCNYYWYFLLTWLPFYLVKVRGFSMEMVAVFGSLPYWAIALTTLGAGWLSDRLIFRGVSPTRVRKTCVAAGLAGVALMIPAVVVHSPTVCMGFLLASCLSYGLTASNVWALTQTLSGPVAAGKWTGMQNTIGNFAGIVAPWTTGLIVSATGNFLAAFAATSVVALFGAGSFLFIIGRVAPIDWVHLRAHGTRNLL